MWQSVVMVEYFNWHQVPPEDVPTHLGWLLGQGPPASSQRCVVCLVLFLVNALLVASGRCLWARVSFPVLLISALAVGIATSSLQVVLYLQIDAMWSHTWLSVFELVIVQWMLIAAWTTVSLAWDYWVMVSNGVCATTIGFVASCAVWTGLLLRWVHYWMSSPTDLEWRSEGYVLEAYHRAAIGRLVGGTTVLVAQLYLYWTSNCRSGGGCCGKPGYSYATVSSTSVDPSVVISSLYMQLTLLGTIVVLIPFLLRRCCSRDRGSGCVPVPL